MLTYQIEYKNFGNVTFGNTLAKNLALISITFWIQEIILRNRHTKRPKLEIHLITEVS